MKTKDVTRNPATTYALSVIGGGVVAGQYIKLACQRYLDWMERKDLIFCPEKAEKVIRFAEKLHHYKGFSGPFILEPWQKFIIYHIYGFYYADRPDKRVVRNVLILTSRKQGKSMLLSLFALFALLADGEPSPEVYVCANSSKQSGVLFGMAKTFAKQLDPSKKHIKPYRDSLKVEQNDGILRAMAFNPDAADGFGASMAITDEYGAATSSAMYDVMKSSMTARKNPLNIIISTAGHSMLSPCYEMRQACIDILTGVKTDDKQVAFIYELDEGDKWDDPEVWIKSNPNLGVSVQKEEIAAAVLEAKNGTSDMAEVKTKTINLWLNSANQWLDPAAVQKCIANVDLEDHRGEFAYFGVDLAATNDLTAMSVMFPYEDKGKVYKTWYFMPQTSLSNGHNASLYQRWNREGLLIITPGDATDFDFVRDKMICIIEDYELTAVGIYYDRMLAHGFATSCNEMGLQAIPFAQSYVNYTSPILDFERGVANQSIAIDSNIITRWCIENAAIKTTTNNLRMVVRKGTKYEKIDGCVAMLMASGGFEQTQYKGINYRK